MIPFPYLILGAILAVFVAGSGGYLRGRHDGRALEAGEQDKAAVAVAKAAQDMQQTAAEAISKIEVKNTTIRQKAEVITREVKVYGECRHTPDALGLLNDALSPGTSEPAPGGKLPSPDPAP